MKSCKKNCVERGLEIVGIVVSLIIAIGVGTLYALNLIPGIIVSLWIVFGLGTLGLILTTIAALIVGITGGCTQLACCTKNVLALLTTGSIGTILMSLISLAANVATVVNTATIVIVALAGLFLGLLLTGIILFLQCATLQKCHRYSQQIEFVENAED